MQQRNSYKFYLDKVIEPLRIKMERIALFISLSDEDLPVIPERREFLHQFVTQTRMYFNDNELLIYKDPETRENYLTCEEFETNIMKVLNKMLDNKRSYEEINFVDVIEEWLVGDVMVQVWFKVYDGVVRDNVEEYLGSLGSSVAVRLAKEKDGKKKIDNNNKNSICKFTINKQQVEPKSKAINHKKDTTKLTIELNDNINNSNTLPRILSPSPKNQLESPQEEPSDTFTYYLQKFYIHYAKKSPNINQTKEFEQLEHFYTTINLNKFMLYCKEIGLLKIDKKITINFVKKLFINNQDERKVVEFDVFVKIVREILLKVFKTEEEMKEKGYELIGVRDRKNFVETMGKVGVLVPLKKIVFSKVENIRKEKKSIDLEMLEKLKSKEKNETKESQQKRLKENTNSLSRLEKQSILQNSGGYSLELRPPPVNKKNQLTKSTSLSTLPTLYSQHQPPKENKILQELLELDIETDDDPYLQRFKDQQKRYEQEQEKEREKYFIKKEILEEKENDKNNWGHHEGVIERMDKRMNNMVKKVR